MIRQLKDTFKGCSAPDALEEYLEHETPARCVAFNRAGTLLAVGYVGGQVLVWDFQTRGVALELGGGHTSDVTAVAFSANGRTLASAASDAQLLLWDVPAGRVRHRVKLPSAAASVHLHPGGAPLALVCLTSGDAPLLLDCDSAKLLGHLPLGTPSGEAPPAKGKAGAGGGGSGGGGKGPCVGVFARGGEAVWVGSPSGSLSLVRLGQHGAPGSSGVVERCQRVCPPGLGVRHLAVGGTASNLVAVTTGGRRILVLDTQPAGEEAAWQPLCECEDAASSGTWACSALSPDGHWLVGAPKGAASSNHLLHVWDLTPGAPGRLHHVLEAPPGSGAATRVAWHPTQRLFLSLASAPPGRVLLWAPHRAENWSAFAPDFRELEENEEHVEREDEFDVQPAPGQGQGAATDAGVGGPRAGNGAASSAGGAVAVDVFTMLPGDPDEPPDALLYLPLVPRPQPAQAQAQQPVAEDAGAGAEQPPVEAEAPGGKRQRLR